MSEIKAEESETAQFPIKAEEEENQRSAEDSTNESAKNSDFVPKSQFIKLRGLPYSATEKDVVHFFGGLAIERIKFVCTARPRPNGEAYVEFKSVEDAGKAMEFDRKEISNRYIEVFSVTTDEAEFAMRPDPEGTGEENYVVRLRGLPYSCKEADIRKFFEGLEPSPAEIVIGGMGGPRPRPSGEAFVRFGTQEAAEKAMEYNNKHMGSRYVEVFQSTMVELNRAKGGGSSAGSYERTGIRPLMSIDRQGSGGYSGSYGASYGAGAYGSYEDYGRGAYNGGYSDYGHRAADYGRAASAVDEPLRVYMRGLPYDADVHAIEAFFSPLRVHSVKLGINDTGRPSGDAIAEFDNYNDVQAGLSRNNQRMGRRYVELFDNRGAPTPMRRLLWKDVSGQNASAAPALDSYLNGGKRQAPPATGSRDTGYHAGPQAMPPAYHDPYGRRAPPPGREQYDSYERDRRPPQPRSAAPTARAPPPPHGRAPDPWGSYATYDQSAWDAYNYSASAADPYSGYAASADRQRESRETQPSWGQASSQQTYGGWGAGEYHPGY